MQFDIENDPILLTPGRMLGEASRAQAVYRSDAMPPRHQANFRVFDPLDYLVFYFLIARTVQAGRVIHTRRYAFLLSDQ